MKEGILTTGNLSEKRIGLGLKKSDLSNNLLDVEGGKDNFMEEYGISIYELKILTEIGFSESEALNMLAEIKNKDRVRDVDVFMKNGVYEEDAVQILSEINRENKKDRKPKYEILMDYGISRGNAIKILEDIDKNKDRKQRKEEYWIKTFGKHGINNEDAINILTKINKLSKVKKNVLDSFAEGGIGYDDAIQILFEFEDEKKESSRLDILEKKLVNQEDSKKILRSVEEDEKNKFSAEKHEKPESYYAEVFPEQYWDTLSLYEKEKVAKQLDFIRSMIGDEIKIRVNPGKIRNLRSKIVMPTDFKGGAYEGDTINVWNLSDLFNLCLLNHESIHLAQQKELRIPNLEKISPKLANKSGYYRWIGKCTIGGALVYLFMHKGKFGKVTYAIASEQEAYKYQGLFDYLGYRAPFAYEGMLGTESSKETISAINKYNYRLEVKESDLYGKFSTIIDKLDQNFEKELEVVDSDEKRENLLVIKKKLDDIKGTFKKLHDEDVEGGEYLEKWDDLAIEYKKLIDDIIGIINSIEGIFSEKYNESEKFDLQYMDELKKIDDGEESLQEKLEKKKRILKEKREKTEGLLKEIKEEKLEKKYILEIKEEILDIDHDLTMNLKVNQTSKYLEDTLNSYRSDFKEYLDKSFRNEEDEKLKLNINGIIGLVDGIKIDDLEESESYCRMRINSIKNVVDDDIYNYMLKFCNNLLNLSKIKKELLDDSSYDLLVWNYVYKINDIRNAVSILEEKVEQLEDFKWTGKSLDEFEITPELRKKRDLCMSALANENVLYLMYDKDDTVTYTRKTKDGETVEEEFNPVFDASYSVYDNGENKSDDVKEEENVIVINKTIRAIERAIKELNMRCHEYEIMPTKIRLEKEGHYKEALKKAEETEKIEKGKLSSEEIKQEKARARSVKITKKEREKVIPEDPVFNLKFPGALGE